MADAIGHRIHQHSPGCDGRAAARGECDAYEAIVLAQVPAAAGKLPGYDGPG